jgi:hypothetical protein
MKMVALRLVEKAVMMQNLYCCMWASPLIGLHRHTVALLPTTYERPERQLRRQDAQSLLLSPSLPFPLSANWDACGFELHAPSLMRLPSGVTGRTHPSVSHSAPSAHGCKARKTPTHMSLRHSGWQNVCVRTIDNVA